jgi:metallophosphoesterase (TIGR03767 family)
MSGISGTAHDGVSRRVLLAATAAAAVTTSVSMSRPLPSPAAAPPVVPTNAVRDRAALGTGHGLPGPVSSSLGVSITPTTAGTTVRSVSTAHGTGPYKRLAEGPGWPRVVRTELAPAAPGRSGRRRVLCCFTQLSDLHLMDTQSPLRAEFVAKPGTKRVGRPHETLTVAAAVSLVERLNSVRHGPVTGAPVSFAITTGDNTDNNSQLELDWFLTLMNGGVVTPDSGSPGTYEGVQNAGLPHYWQPESALRDDYKKAGFPRVDGFFAAALRDVVSPGLAMPWYSVAGNHDQLISGWIAAPDDYFAGIATGSRKVESVPDAEAYQQYALNIAGKDPQGAHLRTIYAENWSKARLVTPDARRAPFTPHSYLAAHLSPANHGPGPSGHGFTAANLAADTLYYTFRIAEGVLGVSLDTTDRGGHYQGSVGSAQLTWLQDVLAREKDQYTIVFSHHSSWTMTNLRPDPTRPKEKRHSGDEVVTLLKQHGNVVAWLNGHTHANSIRHHGSFWEVNTASHVDYPQMARIVELVDNHDGTLSLATTLVESAAPVVADTADLTRTGLASLYRELAYNAEDTTAARTVRIGTAHDHNTELLLKKRLP